MILVLGLISCKKEEAIVLPTVKTFEGAITIDYTQARVSAEVTDQGGAEVTKRGFIYGRSGGAQDTIFCGGGTGVFSAELTDLEPNSTYTYEAFARNAGGTALSGKVTFTTKASVAPTVKTIEVTEITTGGAKCSGKVTDEGGATVTKRGVCWRKSHNPTIDNDHLESGEGIGDFQCEITGLDENTTYYVRAFATNSKGTSYGEELTFATLDFNKPRVITASATNITQTTVKCGGDVTDDGGTNIIERGVCWGTNHNPMVDGNHIVEGTGMGSFTCEITDLSPHTKYYVRAYAINSKGTSYGDEVMFTTLATPPTVSTGNVTHITTTTAKGSGNVTDDGGATVTERGVCWSKSHNPTVSGHHASSGTGTGNFTVNMTDLTSNTTYYMRAYATNNQGTTYGEEVEFKTLSISKPTVTTSNVTEITSSSAKGGGNVTSDGGATVTERGICWSSSHNPTISNHYVASGTGTGSYSVEMTGLNTNTTYYVRAYATNSKGTAYGEEVSFQTEAFTLPTVTTVSVSEVTSNSAKVSGKVNSAGSSTVTARGICYGTSQNPSLSNAQFTTNGTGTGNFTTTLTGLAPNTTYYVRAYATNSGGTSYGSQKTFTTENAINAWLYYGDYDNHWACWGLTAGGTKEWAVMFPTSILSPYDGTSITRIDTYLGETGSYTLKIYRGGASQPTALVYTKNFSVTSIGWNTINVSPITLAVSSNLWVSITTTHNAGQYPAGSCAGVGNPNARWNNDGDGWDDMYNTNGNQDFCFEIQAYVTSQAKGEKGLEIQLPQTSDTPKKSNGVKDSRNLNEGPKKYKHH